MKNPEDRVAVEHDVVVPDAASVIHSLRAIGYVAETAIADLVDNCLDAKASQIDIDMEWDEDRSYIRIQDNGGGMDENTLLQAMRLGSKDPLAKRGPKDLGRFGMGLKTASFSLGTRLTVLTRREEQEFVRCWDLDVIKETNQWTLCRQPFSDSRERLGAISGSSGTIVLIEKLDRLVTRPYTVEKRNKFLRQVDNVEKHLQLVFHRLLEGPNRVQITLNGNQVLPWDPFYSKLPLTHEIAREDHLVGGQIFSIEGFVLPHHSKFTKDQYEEAGGPRGWFDQQGFYIYRNKRLLVAGGWLGTFPKEESTKLARVKVDIDQDSDFSWQIDVKKSVARPPQEAVVHLKRWAEKARALSQQIYLYRGMPQRSKDRAGNRDDFDIFWDQSTRNNRPFFVIHQTNQLLERIRSQCSDQLATELNAYLKLLQDFCPANTITFAPAADSAKEQMVVAEEHRGEMQKIFQLYRAMHVPVDDAVAFLKAIPTFAQYSKHTIVRVVGGG